jgi:endonuclease YncB( thermonuclease family)
LARSYTGVVTHVSDGDTLRVRTSVHGEARNVCIQGIDAPESFQPGGAQAAAALSGRVLDQTLQLQGSARDDYGRMVARVSLSGEDIGRWLEASGHA